MDIRNEIPAHDIERFHIKALEFSSSARSLVLSMLAAGFEVKHKPDNSLVTSVDLRVEEHLRGLIHLHFPEHGIIGEEYPPANPQAAYQWIMDPIDGTEDFVQHLPTFGSILALHYRGEPVMGVIDHPVLDMRVSAAFGLGQYNSRRVTLTDLDPAAIDRRRVLGAPTYQIQRRRTPVRRSDRAHRTPYLQLLRPPARSRGRPTPGRLRQPHLGLPRAGFSSKPVANSPWSAPGMYRRWVGSMDRSSANPPWWIVW
jgi:hypothetical protein